MTKTTGDIAADFLAKRNERAAARPNPLASPVRETVHTETPDVEEDYSDEIERAVDEAVSRDTPSKRP